MVNQIKLVEDWYEENYSSSGLNAQRHYPNEELLRFMGRNFFGIKMKKRKNIHILEIGCGSCANLWMIAKEGFVAHGLDISEEAINLGHKMLDKWCAGGGADLRVASMTELPYEKNYFDAVVDVFSSYCLNEKDFSVCLKNVVRVLKPGGRFFSYTPGKGADAYQNHQPSKMIDSSTLNGIHRQNSPFTGNHYPFRFIHPVEFQELISEAGLKVSYLETVSRSYFSRQETFEHVVLEAVKD